MEVLETDDVKSCISVEMLGCFEDGVLNSKAQYVPALDAFVSLKASYFSKPSLSRTRRKLCNVVTLPFDGTPSRILFTPTSDLPINIIDFFGEGLSHIVYPSKQGDRNYINFIDLLTGTAVHEPIQVAARRPFCIVSPFDHYRYVFVKNESMLGGCQGLEIYDTQTFQRVFQSQTQHLMGLLSNGVYGHVVEIDEDGVEVSLIVDFSDMGNPKPICVDPTNRGNPCMSSSHNYLYNASAFKIHQYRLRTDDRKLIQNRELICRENIRPLIQSVCSGTILIVVQGDGRLLLIDFVGLERELELSQSEQLNLTDVQNHILCTIRLPSRHAPTFSEDLRGELYIHCRRDNYDEGTDVYRVCRHSTSVKAAE